MRTNKKKYVPFTLLAEMYRDLFWDSLRDVHLGPQARDAHVGWIWRNGYATCAAKTTERKWYYISLTEVYIYYRIL